MTDLSQLDEYSKNAIRTLQDKLIKAKEQICFIEAELAKQKQWQNKYIKYLQGNIKGAEDNELSQVALTSLGNSRYFNGLSTGYKDSLHEFYVQRSKVQITPPEQEKP